jgi:hypothetical protein
MNRVRQGWCAVPNPFNRAQVSRVSLAPQDVDAFVFWTRNPRPLMPCLEELDGRGFRYLFLFTLIGYPGHIDPRSPRPEISIGNFHDLAARIGPDKMTWRYDPILLSDVTGVEFHEKNFRRIARVLRGATHRCVISFVKVYRKARKRLAEAVPGGLETFDPNHPRIAELLYSISAAAKEEGMRIFSCAGENDLSPFGISPSRCIDGEFIGKLFSIPITAGKDPAQRVECGCAASRDIGMYDTCLYGCAYCYATSSIEWAKANHLAHDPESPSLV